MTNRSTKRNDINVIEVPATELAEEIGDKRLANSIMLGALAAKADFLKIESLEKALVKSLPGAKKDLMEINLTALRKGAASVK
jgi:2-oxoglutarate ferredoxin oxidoreductase subunit gamma